MLLWAFSFTCTHDVEYLPQAQRITKQCNQPPPTKQQSKYYELTRARQGEQEGSFARASMLSSIYTAPCVIKTNEEIDICSAYNIIQPLTKQCGFANMFSLSKLRHHCFFSPCFFVCTSYMHAAAGLFSWRTEHLAFARRQFAPEIVDLCPLHSHFVSLFLVSERSAL